MIVLLTLSLLLALIAQKHYRVKQARRYDSVTGGAEINLGGHEKFIYVNSRAARGHEKFILVWIKRTKWRPKKKVFSSNISTNSSNRRRILAIFHEFFSDD